MKIENVYLTGVHRYFFRSGVPAKIIGVKMVTPLGSITPRLAYHLQYEDGYEDYVPVLDSDNYSIKTLAEMLN